MELEELKQLLVNIFRLDKTILYDYDNNVKSQKRKEELVADRFGRFPAKSKRWQTPREIVLDIWRFDLKLPESELWELAKKDDNGTM